MSHTERTERRAERKEDGEDDSEEDEPVEIQLSDVTMHPKGTPALASSVEARVFEERVDLSSRTQSRARLVVGDGLPAALRASSSEEDIFIERIQSTKA